MDVVNLSLFLSSHMGPGQDNENCCMSLTKVSVSMLSARLFFASITIGHAMVCQCVVRVYDSPSSWRQLLNPPCLAAPSNGMSFSVEKSFNGEIKHQRQPPKEL